MNSMSEITRLNSDDAAFREALASLFAWEQSADPALESVVRGIIDDVRARGDAALLEYTARFDRYTATDAGRNARLDQCRQFTVFHWIIDPVGLEEKEFHPDRTAWQSPIAAPAHW